MAATYEPIATTTLGSAASSITFSSIPSTYTDLRLVYVETSSDTADQGIRFNSDSGTNYSTTFMYGTGAAVGSNRTTNATYILTWNSVSGSAIPGLKTIDIFSYAGSTYKTALVSHSDDKNGSGMVGSNVGLWRSTSAITSLTIVRDSGNFSTGTTATIWGIKNA